MRHDILTLLCALALAACSSAASPGDGMPASISQTPARADTLSIRLGQTATADGGRLEVRFETRVADSRCPANVVCVWQGDAHVQIITRVAGGAPVTSALHSTLEPTKVARDRYVITMIGLTPYPGAGHDSDSPVLIVRISSE